MLIFGESTNRHPYNNIPAFFGQKYCDIWFCRQSTCIYEVLLGDSKRPKYISWLWCIFKMWRYNFKAISPSPNSSSQAPAHHALHLACLNLLCHFTPEHKLCYHWLFLYIMNILLIIVFPKAVPLFCFCSWVDCLIFCCSCVMFCLLQWLCVWDSMRLAALRPHLGVQGFGGEFVSPLSLLVIQQHHPVNGAHGELGVVRRPGRACHFGSTLLWRQRRQTATLWSD